MSTGAAPKEMLPLAPDQKQVVGSLASNTQLLAGLLLLLGIVYLVSGPVSWLNFGVALLSALLTMVQGVLFALLGLIMLAVSSDFKFLGMFPQYSGNHFRNAAKNLTAFYQMELGLALLIGLIAVVKLLF